MESGREWGGINEWIAKGMFQLLAEDRNGYVISLFGYFYMAIFDATSTLKKLQQEPSIRDY